MKHIQVIVALALALLAAVAPASAQVQCGQEDPLANSFGIVRPKPGVAIESFLAVLNQDFPSLSAVVVDQIAGRNIYKIQFNPPANVDPLEDALEKSYTGLLQYGELMYLGQAPEGKSGSTWVDQIVTAAGYSGQYATTRLNLPQAHAMSTGTGAVVAVLDTGIDTAHPALAGRIAPGGFNVLTNTANTADLGDGLDNDGDGVTDEMTGHGTYVAGLIALAAPGARILPVTVLNSDGVSDNWHITRGLYHAIDRGVEVINLSLSSTYDSMAFLTAIDDAWALGIVTVAAAGNCNTNNHDLREFPAMDDDHNVIGVAAVNDLDVKAPFSNFHENLVLSGPGDSVNGGTGGPNLSRSIVSTIPGGGYRVWEGTSMATPLTAATAALVRAQHPEWPANATTAANVRGALTSTAVPINGLNPGYAGQLGVGRVDAGAAVEQGPIAPQPGDLNNDGLINVNDLLVVIGNWGQVHTSADLNGDGVVNVNDLLIVIGHWS